MTVVLLFFSLSYKHRTLGANPSINVCRSQTAPVPSNCLFNQFAATRDPSEKLCRLIMSLASPVNHLTSSTICERESPDNMDATSASNLRLASISLMRGSSLCANGSGRGSSGMRIGSKKRGKYMSSLGRMRFGIEMIAESWPDHIKSKEG